MSEPLTWPNWLADMPDRDRLRKILAAVQRCCMECNGEAGVADEPSGPHVSVSMAENFIAQMLERPGYLVKFDQPLTAEQVDEFKTRWQAHFPPKGTPDVT